MIAKQRRFLAGVFIVFLIAVVAVVWSLPAAEGPMDGALKTISIPGTCSPFMAFTPGGKELVTLVNGGTAIKSWDTNNWDEKATFETEQRSVGPMCFSVDGQTMALAEDFPAEKPLYVHLRDMKTHKLLASLGPHEGWRIGSMTFSADGQFWLQRILWAAIKIWCVCGT